MIQNVKIPSKSVELDVNIDSECNKNDEHIKKTIKNQGKHEYFNSPVKSITEKVEEQEFHSPGLNK